MYPVSTSDHVQLNITDAFGRQVKQFSYPARQGSNMYKLPVASLPPGVYQLIMQYKNDQRREIKTFVKQ